MTALVDAPASPQRGPARGISRWLHTKPRLRLAALLGAPAAWLIVLYVGSLVALFINSAYSLNEDGSGINKTFTTENYRTILTEQVYRDVAVRTVVIAAAVTLIDVLLALPLAFFIAKVSRARYRNVLVAAVLVPLWASYLVKAFAWRAIIASPGGVLYESVGRSPGYGEVALVVVLAYLWLPFMVVPIYAGLERMPDSLLEASGDLGARFLRTFRSVVMPIIMPSVVAGSVFTFSLTLGDFIAVDLVGGKTQMIGSVVYDNFSANLPLAAAYALVPLLIMIFYLVAIRRSGALEQL